MDRSTRYSPILTSFARSSIVVRSLFALPPTPSSTLFFYTLFYTRTAAAEGQGGGAAIPGHHRRCTAEPGGEGVGGHTGCCGD